MNHLSETIRAIARKADKDRIYFIQEDRFFLYGGAELVLQKMERILDYPPSHRPPCLLIWGPSGNGKTMILDRFRNNHKPYLVPMEDTVVAPVVKIQAANSPHEKDFYNEIFLNLNIPYKVDERVDRKKDRAMEVMNKLRVKVLIIDEFHQMMFGSSAKQRQILNTIKYLSNQMKISVIAAGTIEAFHAIALDPQLNKRFHTSALSLWDIENQDYHNLLHTYEVTLPLREASLLRSKKIAKMILGKTDGTIGEICDFLKAIAIRAIETGKEKIDADLIESTDFDSFEERRTINDNLDHVL